MAITAFLPLISTGLQMGASYLDKQKREREQAGDEAKFQRQFKDLENFKYTNPQAIADSVAEAEKIAGAAQLAGDQAITRGIQQNIAGAQQDSRLAPAAASAVSQGGEAAYQNMLRSAQFAQPYRMRLAESEANTQRMNEEFQRGLKQYNLERTAGSAERARAEGRMAQQEMINAGLTGVSQLIDVLGQQDMNKLYRDLYGDSSGASSDPDAFLRNARANQDALNSRMDDVFAQYRTGEPSGTEAVSEPISDFSAPVVNTVEEAPTVDTAELQRSLAGLGSLPGSDGSGFGMDNSVIGLQMPRLGEGFLNTQAAGPRNTLGSFNTDLSPSVVIDGFYPGGPLDATNPIFRYQVPNQEEGGELPMMTPGEPSHETNEQRLIDKQTGAPIADLMGAETVLNDKQTAQIEKDLKEGDKDGLFRFMKKLFNKPQFKKQRAQNKNYKA